MGINIDKIQVELSEFYETERKKQKKGNAYMRNIYRNRADNIRNGDREVIFFLFNYMGYMFFSGTMTTDNVEKLLYGFEIFAGKEPIWSGIDNYLQLKKTEIQ